MHHILPCHKVNTALIQWTFGLIEYLTQGTVALEFLSSSGWDRVKVSSLGLFLLPLKLNLLHSWFPLARSDTRSLYLSCAAGAPPPHSDNTTVPCHRPSLTWPCTASAGNHCVFKPGEKKRREKWELWRENIMEKSPSLVRGGKCWVCHHVWVHQWRKIITW